MAASAPIKISYSDDEVKVFHPHFKKLVVDFLRKNSLDSKYEIEHHPASVTSTTPDFVIKERPSGKWVLIVEIKRTPGSVKSMRSWDQARNYVRNNKSAHWSSSSKTYFVVTNIELSYFFCERPTASTQFCLLKDGEVDCEKFGDDATKTLDMFSANVLPKIFDLLNRQTEDYSDSLGLILEHFVGLQGNLTSYIANTIQRYQLPQQPKNFGFKNINHYKNRMYEWKRLNDPRSKTVDYKKISREIARDALFRIFMYEYCREYFRVQSISSTLQPIKTGSQSILSDSIRLSLNALERIDFSQIIRSRLVSFVPENIDAKTSGLLNGFLSLLQSDMSNAVKENGSPSYLLNLMTQNNQFYPWEEANGDGKIMTDAELSDFVSEICFSLRESQKPPNVYDPGCGTGNLLSSVYDRIKSHHPKLTHNEILSKLHGCEVDAFLGKLAVFGLTMRSPVEIKGDTKIDILLNDFFEIEKSELGKYDIVIMNPPFIRNDNKVLPLQRKIIEKKIHGILGRPSFMAKARQPNFFFYFSELATALLRDDGIAAYFINKSVLNTQNGVYLKKFFLDNLDICYLIVCPRAFFQNFMVSPCIIIGKRKKSSNTQNIVKFVKIINPNFFTTGYDEITKGTDVKTGSIRIESVLQDKLSETADWKRLLLPMPGYYEIFETSGVFANLNKAFRNIKRGGLASEGKGSRFFFPWSHREMRKKMAKQADAIEPRFRNLALNNSDIPRNYLLEASDLKRQKCVAIPRSTTVSKFSGLNRYISSFRTKYALPKRWRIDGFPSRAQLIIPRASRKTHGVFFNPEWGSSDVYFSSNFICLWNCSLSVKGMTSDDILQFVSAYLNSSFGQIMFEVEAQDREGLRKIEKGPVANRIFIPMNSLDSHKEKIKRIIDSFKKLVYGLEGTEDIPTPRYKLDLAIAELLWDLEPRFRQFSKSPEELATNAELSLSELVRHRREI